MGMARNLYYFSDYVSDRSSALPWPIKPLYGLFRYMTLMEGVDLG
jgi:hypothetical protein